MFSINRASIRTLLIVIASAFTLISCGGGGGSGGGTTLTYTGASTPAAISQTNGQPIAENSYKNGATGTTAGGVLAVQQDTTPGSSAKPHSLSLAKTIKTSIDKAIPESTNNTGPVAVVVTQTTNGTCGGTLSFSLDVNQNTGAFSGTFTFSNYCDEDETISGTMTLSGQVDPNNYDLGSATVTFTNLTTVDGQGSTTSSGTMTFSNTGGIFAEDFTAVVNMTMRDNTTEKTYKLENTTISVVSGVGYEDFTITGRFFDPDHGYVDLTTPTALRVVGTDEFPSSGTLVASGDNGTTTTLEALSNTNYQITINDGTTVTTVSGLWADL